MRRASWILWLMLALLPLRGWAVAGMGLPQGAMSSGAVAQGSVMAPEAALKAAMPPCHQAAFDDGATPAGGPCQACDWCHAAMASAPCVATAAVPPMPRAPPAVAAERDTGRAMTGGLDRPPRTDPV